MLSSSSKNPISRFLSQAFLIPALVDLIFTVLVFFVSLVHVDAQSTASIEGQVVDPDGANIITSNITVNGVANTLRPDVTGPIKIVGSVERWFDTSVFVPVARTGSLGRNVVIGPRFDITDFSIIKNTILGKGMRVEFRSEFFDIFNHPNFGRPGNVVGTPTFKHHQHPLRHRRIRIVAIGAVRTQKWIYR